MRRPKERQLAADAAAIEAAEAFTVVRFAGRGRFDLIGIYPTLAAASQAQAAAGADPWGRTRMIYAIAMGRSGVFVG